MGMKIVSTAYLSDRVVIKLIQTDNTNRTKSKFQSDRTEGLGQSGINVIVIKQAQKRV